MGISPLWPWNAATISGTAAMATQAQTRVPKGIKLWSAEKEAQTGEHFDDSRDHGNHAGAKQNALHGLAPRVEKEREVKDSPDKASRPM